MSEHFPNEIRFNKPYLTGKELDYIKKAVKAGKTSGNGPFTKKCQNFIEEHYNIGKCLLTTSCTDALEMSAILADINPGDEVILPSYTFVSTANAFVLRGASLKFTDSRKDHPGIDETKIEELITSKTKAIVPVHYAGVACNMDMINDLANKYNIKVIEDAAQAIDSFYINNNGEKQALGSIGHLSTFSFHETKNIMSGEGGLLGINEAKLMKRAEIIWEKGTNRAAFYRGEIDKYGWVDIGSSFLPSDITAAFLYAQLEYIDDIQSKRIKIWERYNSGLKVLKEKGCIKMPYIPKYATNNAHMFYVVCENLNIRDKLIQHLKKQNIFAVFHYLPLHKSSFFEQQHDGRELKFTEQYSNCLLRLPLFYELDNNSQDRVIKAIIDFYI